MPINLLCPMSSSVSFTSSNRENKSQWLKQWGKFITSYNLSPVSKGNGDVVEVVCPVGRLFCDGHHWELSVHGDKEKHIDF